MHNIKHTLKHYVIKPLLIIGGLNWGLVGLLNFDLVAAIFGSGTMLSRLIYILVGLSAVAMATFMAMPHDQKRMK